MQPPGLTHREQVELKIWDMCWRDERRHPAAIEFPGHERDIRMREAYRS